MYSSYKHMRFKGTGESRSMWRTDRAYFVLDDVCLCVAMAMYEEVMGARGFSKLHLAIIITDQNRYLRWSLFTE